jgi:hypothetical protein
MGSSSAGAGVSRAEAPPVASGIDAEPAAWQATRLDLSEAVAGLLDQLAAEPRTTDGAEDARSETGILRGAVLAEFLREHRAEGESRQELIGEILDELSALLSQSGLPAPEGVAG